MTDLNYRSRSLSALLIGDFRSPTFQPVADQIRSAADVETAADCDDAIAMVNDTAYVPNIIVVAQRWPGQYHHGKLDQLQRAVPLGRILALSGTWCEGELRSGLPWPGMVRTYWHAWLARWDKEFSRHAAAELPAWGLPTTATAAERTLLTYDFPASNGGLIAVYSPSHDTADMLCATCRQFGYGAVWLDQRRPPHIEGPTAILWEGSPDALDDLADARATFPDVPLFALMDFPRWEDVEKAKSLGAATVLSKPFMIDDLHRQLDAVLNSSSRAKATDERLRVVA